MEKEEQAKVILKFLEAGGHNNEVFLSIIQNMTAEQTDCLCKFGAAAFRAGQKIGREIDKQVDKQ